MGLSAIANSRNFHRSFDRETARYSPSLKISSKLSLRWLKNMVVGRILTCRGRLPRAKRSCNATLRTANQIAKQPLISQSRGRATNSLWRRDWQCVSKESG